MSLENAIMKKVGFGPSFRDKLHRRQKIRTKAKDAGLPDTDFSAIEEWVVYLMENGENIDPLEFMDNVVNIYANTGILPE